MSEYIFYTTEGYTLSPNETEVENLQIIGFAFGKNKEEALSNLLLQNTWIEKAKFSICKMIVRQVV